MCKKLTAISLRLLERILVCCFLFFFLYVVVAAKIQVTNHVTYVS